jgi:hypothetical protein
MMKLLAGGAAASVLVFLLAAPAGAVTVYGNSASSGNNPIHIINAATGVESQRFTGQPGGNGRGVVTVGDTLYYTVVSDPHIYSINRNTGAPIGSLLTSNASMSTLAWDGSHFWTADYSGTNKAFRIDATTGLNVKTISLEGAQNFMDGLEWYNGKLIGNRCDACGTYDIWDLDGKRLVTGFITAPSSATGIAYDGTNFLVSNIFNSSIGVYDFTSGALLNTVHLTGSMGGFLIEDLSIDYAARPDTGGGIPEPATWATMILGFGAIGSLMRRRRLQLAMA